MTPLSRYAITAGVAGLVGFASASYLRPPVEREYLADEVTTSSTVTLTKLVYRYSQAVDRTHKREEFYPNGKPKAIETETEKIQTDVASSEESQTSANQLATSKVTDIRRPSVKDWALKAMAGFDLRTREPVYGLAVDRRILGPFTAGVWVTTKNERDTVFVENQEVTLKTRSWSAGLALGVQW